MLKLGVLVLLTVMVLSKSKSSINMLNDQHTCDVPSKSVSLWAKFRVILQLAVMMGATRKAFHRNVDHVFGVRGPTVSTAKVKHSASG